MTQIIHNGISFARLLYQETHSPFIDLIKCKICFNILLNPYDCNVCKNSFCYDCINTFITNNLPCPFKCEKFSIKPSSFGITSYLAKLEFNCLNKQNGCQEVIPYASVIDHEKECKFFYTTCPNVQCGKTMKWTLIENHLKNECDFTLFKCPFCDMAFKRNDHSAHVSNCQNVKNSLQYVINNNQPRNNKQNNNAKDEDKNDYIDINKLIQSLPDLNEMSLVSFIKILLYQINQSNKCLNEKFDAVQNEMLKIREESDKSCRNNMIFFENINNELENLNSKLEFIETNDSIKQSINESMQNPMMKPSSNIDLIDEFSTTHNNNNNSTLPLNSSSSISDALRVSNRKPGRGNDKLQTKKTKGLDQIKEVSSMDKAKNEKRSRRLNVIKYEKKSNCYSPRQCPQTNSSSTQNKSDSYIGDNKFNPPIAKPFNTFSNFTNSNLISIINNQEIIISKLDALSEKVEENTKKHLKNISKQLSFPVSMIIEEKKYENEDTNVDRNDLILNNNKKEDEIIANIQLDNQEEERYGDNYLINKNDKENKGDDNSLYDDIK